MIENRVGLPFDIGLTYRGPEPALIRIFSAGHTDAQDGEESALFAGDLLRMYTRYAERAGWSTEILDATESDLGGYKSVTLAVKAWRARPSRATRRTGC